MRFLNFFSPFPLCLLFICRCTGGLFTLLKRMRDPRDAALHAKLLWKGLGEEKGRNFQAFWNRAERVCGLFLLLLCPMHVGSDVATAYADIAGPWTSKMGPAVKGWSGKSLQSEHGEAWETLRLDVEALSSCQHRSAPHSACGIAAGRLLSNWRSCCCLPPPPC